MSSARPPSDRQVRRQAQSLTDRARAQQGTAGSSKRLWLIVIGAAVVIGAVVGILLATRSSSPPTGVPDAGSGSLSLQTVVKIPAASAVVRGDGGAWVTDDLRNLLIRFDPATGKTRSTRHLAGRPVALVLAHGDLWVASMITNTVDEISPASLKVLASVSVPTGPSGLAVLNGRIWVTSVIGNTLTSIDPVTAKAGPPITLSAGAVRVAAGFGALSAVPRPGPTPSRRAAVRSAWPRVREPSGWPTRSAGPW
jgi:streptogramin lyase